MSNWELFQTAYQNASSELKAVIDSELIPTAVRASLGADHDPSKVSKLVVQVSYRVLGIQNIDTTVSNLKSLGVADAQLWLAKVESFIEKQKSIDGDAISNELTDEIAETEEALSSLQGVRTMANDMRVMHGEEPVYRSTQADILPQSGEPKWESEAQ